MIVRWTPLALADLAAIGEHVAADDPTAAARLMRRLREAVEKLASHPAMGRPGRVAETRECVVSGTSYIIPYRVRRDELHVLRVIHAARRWPPRLS